MMNDDSAKEVCMRVNLERQANMVEEEEEVSGSGSGEGSLWVTDDEDDEVSDIFRSKQGTDTIIQCFELGICKFFTMFFFLNQLFLKKRTCYYNFSSNIDLKKSK